MIWHDIFIAMLFLGGFLLSLGVYFALGHAVQPETYVLESGPVLCYTGLSFCAIGLIGLGIEALLT